MTSPNVVSGGLPQRFPQAPEWAHRLLTSYLTGVPLDFGGLVLPEDIRARLDAAYIAGVLKGGVPEQITTTLMNANHQVRGPVEESPRHCWKTGPHTCGEVWTDHNYVGEPT